MNWLEAQIEAHTEGADGGVGNEPMGELKIEGIYPLAYIRMLTGVEVERVFARTTAHFHQLNADNDVEDLATVTLEMERGMLGSLCIGRIGAASHPDGTHLVVSGGVAANHSIRSRLAALCKARNLEFAAPPLALCTDNAAMIAWAGIERIKKGDVDDLSFRPRPRWPLDPDAPKAAGAGVKA